MINQIMEAKDFIAGKSISKQNVYKMCYVIAKYLMMQNMEPIAIRNYIFDWANKNGIFIKYSVNDIIMKAAEDGIDLRGDMSIWVSEEDVKEIASRFDEPSVRLTALALLCCSKAFANSKGEFSAPQRALAQWLGVGRENLRTNILRRLVAFGYIQIIDHSDGMRKWNKVKPIDGSLYKILPPITDGQKYKLIGNDIKLLCDTIFPA